jgi:hypothetical protein
MDTNPFKITLDEEKNYTSVGAGGLSQVVAARDVRLL